MLNNIFYTIKGFKHIKRKPPIFIVGCGRSGTTLLLSILSSDNSLYCLDHETEIFKHGFFAEPGPPGIMWKKVDKCSTVKAKIAKLKILLKIARQSAPSSTQYCFVEKTPIHIRTIDCIRKAYQGRVRFIHIVRDGRDVVTSLHPSNPGQFHIHPERWVYDVGITESCINDEDALIIRYEDLVNNFIYTISNIYKNLQMDIPESIFTYWENARIRKHVAWSTGVKDLSNKGIERWKKQEYEERVRALLEIPDAKRLLRVFNYCNE